MWEGGRGFRLFTGGSIVPLRGFQAFDRGTGEGEVDTVKDRIKEE